MPSVLFHVAALTEAYTHNMHAAAPEWDPSIPSEPLLLACCFFDALCWLPVHNQTNTACVSHSHAAAPEWLDPSIPSEPLLLACRFFDAECAGYLETDDLEEVLYMTNADVSREWFVFVWCEVFLLFVC